jgi:hypothetical protein
MKKTTIIILAIMSFLMVKAQSPKQSQEMLARISVIEVFPQYLQEYLNYALTIGATSVKVEPGVICIFPMLQKGTVVKSVFLKYTRTIQLIKATSLQSIFSITRKVHCIW